MNKIKTEKGITLVALIITIVVLLILAGVAIGTVKNSDIIGYAQNAAGSYNQAKDNELDALTEYESKIESVLEKDRLYSYIEADFHIKITTDKKIIFILPAGQEQAPEEFEYVAVTQDIINAVELNAEENGMKLPSLKPEYYSKAITLVGEDYEEGNYFLLLSRNEEILYYSGHPLTLAE